MSRRRFFVEEVRGSQAVLEGEDARHLARVLRAETGQEYELSDNDAVYLARIEEVGRETIRFSVLERLEAPAPGPYLTLAAALIKFDHFEWMLEKATELGVEAIVPVNAARSEKGLDLAARKRLDRWRRILRESSQQSRRARMPQIHEPETFEVAVRNAPRHAYFLEEEAGAPPILSALPEPAQRSGGDDIRLLVGPEGGWTAGERAFAVECGWKAVSLGPNILRAETAALAALAVLGNAWRTR